MDYLLTIQCGRKTFFKNTKKFRINGALLAVEMKKKGTWDSYVEDCKNRKKKTAEEIKRELMEKYPST